MKSTILLIISSQLDLESLLSALRALDSIAERRNAELIAYVKADGPEDAVLDAPLPYDPAIMFLLEIMVSISCQTPQYIEEIWYVWSPSMRAGCLILVLPL